ncbi:hypothetical protein C8Q76DRAFT_800958 [Earliella scabrosa]|nr:hypothetical protein C8Q76DRAFT_800958 [Earliella scabrosa]
MSLRLPFDIPPLGLSDVPLSPLSLDDVSGLEASSDTSKQCPTILSLRQILGEAPTVEDGHSQPVMSDAADALPSSDLLPISIGSAGGSLQLSYRSLELASSTEDDSAGDLHSVTDESTVSDDEDDGDDDVARALAFAKMRAAYSGMSAAMINFSAAIQESDDEEGDSQLSVLASKVISSICQSPPALERHMSLSSLSSDETDEDDLTDAEREDCIMVKAYIERWASNIRLASTFWQGFTPMHTNVSVSPFQRLIVYQAEQAIRKVSEQLDIPAPLEFERPCPRLSRDPVNEGFAGRVEFGTLSRRVPPQDYCPMTRLEEIRCALNSDKGKKVQTVSVRLQAGAKRAAGTQRPKEAHTIRNTWERTLSRRRVDITLWLMTEELETDAPANS